MPFGALPLPPLSLPGAPATVAQGLGSEGSLGVGPGDATQRRRRGWYSTGSTLLSSRRHAYNTKLPFKEGGPKAPRASTVSCGQHACPVHPLEGSLYSRSRSSPPPPGENFQGAGGREPPGAASSAQTPRVFLCGAPLSGHLALLTPLSLTPTAKAVPPADELCFLEQAAQTSRGEGLLRAT